MTSNKSRSALICLVAMGLMLAANTAKAQGRKSTDDPPRSGSFGINEGRKFGFGLRGLNPASPGLAVDAFEVDTKVVGGLIGHIYDRESKMLPAQIEQPEARGPSTKPPKVSYAFQINADTAKQILATIQKLDSSTKRLSQTRLATFVGVPTKVRVDSNIQTLGLPKESVNWLLTPQKSKDNALGLKASLTITTSRLKNAPFDLRVTTSATNARLVNHLRSSWNMGQAAVSSS